MTNESAAEVALDKQESSSAADEESDGAHEIAQAEQTALLVLLRTQLGAHEPFHRVARQCNEVRKILRGVIDIYFKGTNVRMGAVSADDASVVIFGIPDERFAPLAERHGSIIHSYTEIPANIHVLSDKQLADAEKKPAGFKKKGGIVAASVSSLTFVDEDESDDRVGSNHSKSFDPEDDD